MASARATASTFACRRATWRFLFRVDGVVRNVDDWCMAFGINPGDPLRIPPEKHARVWRPATASS